jgi:hypothetical protein
MVLLINTVNYIKKSMLMSMPIPFFGKHSAKNAPENRYGKKHPALICKNELQGM